MFALGVETQAQLGFSWLGINEFKCDNDRDGSSTNRLCITITTGVIGGSLSTANESAIGGSLSTANESAIGGSLSTASTSAHVASAERVSAVTLRPK